MKGLCMPRLMSLTLLLALLGSCAEVQKPVRSARPPVRLQGIEAGVPVALAPDEAVVFGSILIVDNGRPKKHRIGLSLRNSSRGAGAPITVEDPLYLFTEDDGSFYVVVRAGQYEVSGVGPWGLAQFCLPHRFDAPEAGKAYYVGALKIEITSTLWGTVYPDAIKHVEVLDEFDSMARALASRAPGAATLPLEKSMLTQIPGKRVVIPLRDNCK